jgi:dGTPase
MTHTFLGNLDDLRRTAEEREEQTLSPLAALSKDHSRREGAELDHRLAYKRDVDRIVHSRAYARYIDKTQVLYLVDNDHITHRVLHVQLVSNFARGIAEILGLNCDLVEAIALGHDVGHPPFGHEGEGYLSQLSVEAGEGPFAHPAQSCRLLSVIEPLNLGLAVYDGFLCHDGGLRELKYEPKLGKNWEDHDRELAEKWSDPDGNIWPGTMEGCLVKLCDTASYLGRDIEDAIRIGILKRDEVPQTVLGVSNREILSRVARDIIAQSEDHISISAEVMEALKVLRQFNFERIYMEPTIKVESSKIERSYRILFETLLNDFEKRGDGSLLWRKFLHNKGEAYRSGSSGARLVIDYISGMTDNYFVRAVEEVVVPRRIALK